jgi:dTDP-4-amino-4,6-dideoxygalactose transaminase
MVEYNAWPIGQVPKHLQRPELDQIRELGYDWKDPRDVVDMFEKKVAKYAGSKYAVSVDCCSHGIFLALQCIKRYRKNISTITIPKHTYVSVPQQIIHAGFKVKLEDREWSGIYQLKPYSIWDGATRWQRDMYMGGFHIVSFQLKKRVPIGRGGMILLDNKNEYEYLKKIRYDGRDLDGKYDEDPYEYIGWHYYMTPEDAARGIIIMDQIPEYNDDSGGWQNYPDLSKARFLNESVNYRY